MNEYMQRSFIVRLVAAINYIHGYRTVSFKDAPINEFKVELQVPRYKCFCCGYTQSYKNELFHPHYRITKRAYSCILSELQREDATITKISRTSGIHWQIVYVM